MSLESTATLKAEVCKDASGGLVRAQYEWMGCVYDIASVYAPAKAPKRVDFLSHVHQRLSDHTIACGDWNCVPDVTLDVKSSNPLNYPNAGATLLADVMARFNLHDYRREQLETGFEPTRSGTNSQGAPVATRLDRFYLPTHADFDSTLWDIHVCPTLVWSKENSDHLPVVLTIEPSVGERGHERETIREELVFKPDIQEKILAALSKAYEGASSLNKKWSRANNMIRHLLLTETAKLKKKENIETKATHRHHKSHR